MWSNIIYLFTIFMLTFEVTLFLLQCKSAVLLLHIHIKKFKYIFHCYERERYIGELIRFLLCTYKFSHVTLKIRFLNILEKIHF